jgi:hypothetical protein
VAVAVEIILVHLTAKMAVQELLLLDTQQHKEK